MTTEFKVWCDPVFRENTRKLIVCKGDVTAALEWYKGKFGCLPVKIGLSPVNQYHAEEVPAGIEIFYLAGILSWEIWLSWEKKTEEKSPEPKTDPPAPLQQASDAPGRATGGLIPPKTHNSTPRIMTHLKMPSTDSQKPEKMSVVIKIPKRRAKKTKAQERLL